MHACVDYICICIIVLTNMHIYNNNTQTLDRKLTVQKRFVQSIACESIYVYMYVHMYSFLRLFVFECMSIYVYQCMNN